jgi:hypothetical protein
VQGLPSSGQLVPAVSRFGRQVPKPLQVSGLSQALSLGLPQGEPGAFGGSEQTPVDGLQVPTS